MSEAISLTLKGCENTLIVPIPTLFSLIIVFDLANLILLKIEFIPYSELMCV